MSRIHQFLIPLLALTHAACATQGDPADDDVGGGGKSDGAGTGKIEIKGSGFTAQAGADLHFGFVQPIVDGRARQPFTYDALHPKVAADGSVSFLQHRGNDQAYKLIAYIDADGTPGCSAQDYVASVMVGDGDADAILELTPQQLPKAEPIAQELADCNELFAPRFHAKTSISGFTGIDGHLMGVYTLPHPGYSFGSEGGSGIGSGMSSFSSYEALTYGYREKLIMYVDRDGLPGCSENDIIAAVETDPVTGPLTFAFSPTNLPRSADPAQDLHDCDKFSRLITVGDYDVTVRGSGFDAQEGKSVLVGDQQGVRATGTVVGGAFELKVEDYAWESDSAALLVLIDGNGDGHCGDPSDKIGLVDASYVTADVIADLTPQTASFPIPQCW